MQIGPMDFLLPAENTDMLPTDGAIILSSWKSDIMEDGAENKEEPLVSFMPVMLSSGLLCMWETKLWCLINYWWVSVTFNLTHLNCTNWLHNFQSHKNQPVVNAEVLSRTKYTISSWLCVVHTVELKAGQHWPDQCCGSKPSPVALHHLISCSFRNPSGYWQRHLWWWSVVPLRSLIG